VKQQRFLTAASLVVALAFGFSIRHGFGQSQDQAKANELHKKFPEIVAQLALKGQTAAIGSDSQEQFYSLQK
jgi:hypothetical protein